MSVPLCNSRSRAEAAVDIARLTGLSASGEICEVVNDDGTMARRRELERFAERHGLHLITRG